MDINVMIVDDSILVRVLLKDIIEKSGKNFKVVATASNGNEAIKILKSNPNIDLITLDILMPEKNGLETLKEVLKIKEIPVVMISSYTSEGAKETIEALSMGAVDFITKNSDEEANYLYDLEEEIIQKLTIASKSKVNVYNKLQVEKARQFQVKIKHIIGIGSSTGGPGALKVLFSSIPLSFVAPIIIAQHMPEGIFTKTLSKKLNEISHYNVKVIENGEEIKPRTAYLCPGGFSVEVFERGEALNLVLTKKNIGKGLYNPSVDMLFSSISRLDKTVQKTGIILTGMGDDGSKGSLALSREGGTIIAESHRTSIVYGMPKKVLEQDIPVHVADIDKIFKYIKR